ncbi:MAG TPA: C45 family peptidase [Bdellovibrionota bacterium]|jgi:isopenicillin-N N-acyltransferase-like protein|nr:C45 family peptidase [Bdellovibrionota bacterium]
MLQIKLSGDAKSIGHQHGETFRNQIHQLADIRRGLARGFFWNSSETALETYALAHVESLRKHPDLFTEFYAIATAANLSLVDLMILNNYTDLRDFSVVDKSRKNDGCSVIGLRNAHRTLVGQTWDMHASATPFTVYMELDEAGSDTQIKALTLTGCLGLAGVNSHGVSAMINNMHCLEVNPAGLAWNALVRKVLRAKTAAEGVRTIETNLPCSGHSYVVSDKEAVINVETTGLQVLTTARITAPGGHTFHTNHYLNNELRKQENMERQSKTTHQRYHALETYFKTQSFADMTLADFERDFFSVGAAADTICMPAPLDPHGPMTSGGLIIDHTERKGLAFQGIYNDKNHLRFEF